MNQAQSVCLFMALITYVEAGCVLFEVKTRYGQDQSYIKFMVKIILAFICLVGAFK